MSEQMQTYNTRQASIYFMLTADLFDEIADQLNDINMKEWRQDQLAAVLARVGAIEKIASFARMSTLGMSDNFGRAAA